MPVYHSLGSIPRKRHTVFRQPNGSLYYEHLIGSDGFSGPASLLYHVRRPTTVVSSKKIGTAQLVADPEGTLKMRHFRLAQTPAVKSATLHRTPLLFNNEVSMWIVRPTQTDDFYYRNAQGDEIIYVSEGTGILDSQMGELAYRTGDYVIVPRGITYRLRLGDGATLLMVIESVGRVRPPSRYCNVAGQLMEHSPYCERDIRAPNRLEINDREGEHAIVVKHDHAFIETILDHHPIDVVGWDGFYYPWALSIHDFEPITGSLHQPPPVHQTFASDGFVVCSFVPRLFDYHPDAVPAPYNHSNAMSDEILYYANNEFMSRKGIEYGSLTLHPGGLPHGPHPGRTEGSIGKRRTEELAVMLDTFRPLAVAKDALTFEDGAYAALGSATNGWRKALALIAPGLAMCVVGIVWGLNLNPPRRPAASIAGVWFEPKLPDGVFCSFRENAATIVAETQPFAPHHPRAHSYLVPKVQPQAPFSIRVRATFERGRTIGIDLARDGTFSAGIRLSTGMNEGLDAGRAVVRRLGAKVEVGVLLGSSLELQPNKAYELAFIRDYEFVRLEVDAKEVLRFALGAEAVDSVRFFVQNSKVELSELRLTEDGP